MKIVLEVDLEAGTAETIMDSRYAAVGSWRIEDQHA